MKLLQYNRLAVVLGNHPQSLLSFISLRVSLFIDIGYIYIMKVVSKLSRTIMFSVMQQRWSLMGPTIYCVGVQYTDISTKPPSTRGFVL